MRANGREQMCVLTHLRGSSAFVFRLGYFRQERPGLKDERRRDKQDKISSKDKLGYKNVEGGCARADSEGTLNETTKHREKKNDIKH